MAKRTGRFEWLNLDSIPIGAKLSSIPKFFSIKIARPWNVSKPGSTDPPARAKMLRSLHSSTLCDYNYVIFFFLRNLTFDVWQIAYSEPQIYIRTLKLFFKKKIKSILWYLMLRTTLTKVCIWIRSCSQCTVWQFSKTAHFVGQKISNTWSKSIMEEKTFKCPLF